jgi:hypothetical protein
LQKINSLLAYAPNTRSTIIIDAALDVAKQMRNERNEVLHSVESVWYEEWFPRVTEANGRKFLDVVDDVKDHVPIRTVDMSYLVYRQLNYPMDKWWQQLIQARNKIAQDNILPLRNDELHWKSIY